ncbi:MAG TPA: hypothetical protein VGD84_08590 [Pseudonocardiaceae bacterium]
MRAATRCGFVAPLFMALDEAPRPGSLDALMAASHDGPFATDLRRLSPADTTTVAAITEQRYGDAYADVNPLAAYDIVVHIRHVTAAEPDRDTIAHASIDLREAFAR